jgi:hypothetical protein
LAELQGAVKAQSMVMKRKNQANKRLKEHLEVRSKPHGHPKKCNGSI